MTDRVDAASADEGWFVPHETMIKLPDGRELTVDGIPYEGWGTAPGRYSYLFDYVEADDGRFDFSDLITWQVTSPSDYHLRPSDAHSSPIEASSGNPQ